jgi:hypothetical protein
LVNIRVFVVWRAIGLRRCFFPPFQVRPQSFRLALPAVSRALCGVVNGFSPSNI